MKTLITALAVVQLCVLVHACVQTDRQIVWNIKKYLHVWETAGRNTGRHLLSWVRRTTLFSISGIIRKGPTEYEFVTQEFLKVVLMKIWVFWKVMPYELTNSYLCFKQSRCLHLHGQAVQEVTLLGLLHYNPPKHR